MDFDSVIRRFESFHPSFNFYKLLCYNIIVMIQIIRKKYQEKTLPYIHLTKSKNFNTGTLTLLFYNPSIFKEINILNLDLTETFLEINKKIIVADNINILYKDGKPIILKISFIILKKEDFFWILQNVLFYSQNSYIFF